MLLIPHQHSYETKSDIYKETTQLSLIFPIFSRKRIVEVVFSSILDCDDNIYRHVAPWDLLPVTMTVHMSASCVKKKLAGNLPLALRRDRQRFLFICKVLIGNSPSYITSLLHWSNSHYSKHWSDWSALVPRANTNAAVLHTLKTLYNAL